MKKMFAVIFVLLMTFSFILQTADAKRFGGGRSFGASRSANSFSRNTTSHYNAPQQRNHSLANKSWLGPLAGLMAGGLLASLFMSHGLGSGILSWLLVAGVLFLLVRWFKSSSHTQSIYNQEKPSTYQHQATHSMYATSSGSNTRPVGFDDDEFLRQAKVMFIRMQAAYDKKDLQDIRDFTTPEVYAEIQLQCQERGDQENVTHVVSLEAELLNIENEREVVSQSEIEAPFASVRFSGLIQERKDDVAHKFTEIWHFSKTPGNYRWLVAGIQQDS